MEIVSSVDAKNAFGDVVMKAQKEPVCISKNGKPAAVMISMQDYEEIQSLRERLLHQRLDEGLKAAQKGCVSDSEDVFKELMDIASV
ncbi:type II toxin-antitoxin system Phd/YefM family antitoxin [Ningiella sp. W23]|uniref:type II toxin-antitoxin system Phd/YefM family antitoxin n=1 Tax=Ningiella sp. W23 TaxID=3023715 RepID=UPI003756F61E